MKNIVDDVTSKVTQYINTLNNNDVGVIQHTDLSTVKQRLGQNDPESFHRNVRKFVELIDQEGLQQLNNDTKIRELGNSILRFTDAYDNHDKAVKNFKNLDRSKFSKDDNTTKIEALINTFNKNKKYLKPNDKFKIEMNIPTALATQKLEYGDSNPAIVDAFAAGMIAKVSGKKSPIKQNKNVIPPAITQKIMQKAIDLAKEHHGITEQKAMDIGKKLGKETRNDLFKNKNNTDKIENILNQSSDEIVRTYSAPPPATEKVSKGKRSLSV